MAAIQSELLCWNRGRSERGRPGEGGGGVIPHVRSKIIFFFHPGRKEFHFSVKAG